MLPYLTDDELKALQARLAGAREVEWLQLAAEHAWHLRQRDTRTALAEVRGVQDRLSECADPMTRECIEARLSLTRAEAHLLYGDPTPARDELTRAAATFERLGDFVGQSDALFLEAHLEFDLGRSAERDAAIRQAALFARAAGDDLRADICDIRAAYFDIFVSLGQAEARWRPFVERCRASDDPCLRRVACEYLAIVAYMKSEIPQSIKLAREAAALGQWTGHRREAINDLTNAAIVLVNLKDYETALECFVEPIRQAREAQWPKSLGHALQGCAQILLKLGRIAEARRMGDEAMQWFQHFPDSSHSLSRYQWMGEIAVQEGDFERAMAAFRSLEQMAIKIGYLDGQIRALNRQAELLCKQGRLDMAMQSTLSALGLARMMGGRQRERDSLQILSRIHAELASPAPEGSTWPNAQLHYLNEALDVSLRMDGFPLPSDLLYELSHAHASAQDYEAAYKLSIRAREAFEREHSEQAMQRAVALEIRHETERARAEAAHQARMAQEQTRRAEEFEQNGRTLQRLGAIGQEITAHLEAQHICQALDRHVHALVDATSFCVFLLDEPRGKLACAFAVVAGATVPMPEIALDDAMSDVADCARTRSVVLGHPAVEDGAPTASLREGPPSSTLCAPLISGDRLLGVMALRSPRAQAYGEREQLILRSLCAYGAIALDNARTCGELRQLQAALHAKNDALTRANQTLATLSVVDPLTGLHNRRFLMQQIGADVAQCLRTYERVRPALPSDADLALLIVDVDHFKQINDVRGHVAGDLVLVQLAERLKTLCRAADYIVRWGGEEFMLVLRQTTRLNATFFAERVRTAIGATAFQVGEEPLSVTVSVGYACLPMDPCRPAEGGWEAAVAVADEALYRAKKAGRNRTMGPVDLDAGLRSH